MKEKITKNLVYLTGIITVVLAIIAFINESNIRYLGIMHLSLGLNQFAFSKHTKTVNPHNTIGKWNFYVGIFCFIIGIIIILTT